MLLWLISGLTLACVTSVCFLIYQWRRFQAAVVAHRTRRMVVLHTGSSDAQVMASKLARKSGALVMSVDDLARLREGFFHLVDGSVSLCVVTDDRDEAVSAGPLLGWLATESATRAYQARVAGWNSNIVYTEEGKRRTAFMRLAFSVVSVHGERLPTVIGGFLKSFSALQVEDALEYNESVQLDVHDVLDVWSFYAWLFGCSCCVQRDVECMRHRPSSLRAGLSDLIRAAWTSKEMASQLRRALMDWLGANLPFRTFSRQVPFPYAQQMSVSLPGDVFVFEALWGDEALLEETEKGAVDASLYVVSSQFRIVAQLGHLSHEHWLWEVASRFPGKHVVVTHPRSGAEVAFQIGSTEILQLLESLIPGAPAKTNSPHQHWFVASKLWVRADGSDAKENADEMRREMNSRGYTVIAPHTLIPAPYWNAVRRYHRALRPWLYEYAGEGRGRGKFRTWNDEPVARQLQYTLTNWVGRIMRGERLVQSSLSLSIFIQKGPGFIYHTDSSPPFDLTLDIVADHVGREPRPVFVVRPASRQGGGVLVERLELKYGEAVLFKGAELTHFGGDLKDDAAFHSVQLYTWQYARD